MSNKNGSKWITQKRRLAIYLRDNMQCCYCFKSLEDGIVLSLDHVVPRKFGGDNKSENLITACKSCNEIRQDRDIVEYVNLYHKFYGLNNVTPDMMIAHINGRLAADMKQFIGQAQEIINNRPNWSSALQYASMNKGD